jgi:lipopolysaccharide/colanic/teichoic acid biosynthesis glycosyltransferase
MLKRTVDLLLASIALLVLSPLMLPVIVILRLTGEGKVFYRQDRVGKGGKLFGLLKFATMLENSPNMTGGDITVRNDPRVLPFGRILRKTKINELPQLLNVFLGDMSIIGPRPLTPRTFSYYSKDVQEQISPLKPGLSGIGSIIFRDEESILANSQKPHLDCYKEDIAPYKGALEIWYKQHQSFLLDVSLIFLTLWVILFSKSRLPHKLFSDLPKSQHPLI